jgi:hypothetical protein
MAATLTQERFTGPDWIFERKFDGIRLLAYKNGSDVKLFSRNRLPQNLPSIAQAIKNLPANELILDGEVTWGRPCTWEEVERCAVGPRSFTLRTMTERIACVGDLWADMLKTKRSLRSAIERLKELSQ